MLPGGAAAPDPTASRTLTGTYNRPSSQCHLPRWPRRATPFATLSSASASSPAPEHHEGASSPSRPTIAKISVETAREAFGTQAVCRGRGRRPPGLVRPGNSLITHARNQCTAHSSKRAGPASCLPWTVMSRGAGRPHQACDARRLRRQGPIAARTTRSATPSSPKALGSPRNGLIQVGAPLRAFSH